MHRPLAVVLPRVLERGILEVMGHESDGEAGGGAGGTRWRNRPTIMMIVATVALVCAVIAMGVLGAVTRLQASDAHARSDRLSREFRGSVRSERVHAMQLTRLVDRAGSVSRSLDEFMAAVRVEADASNRVVGALNRHADLLNAGRRPDAVVVLQGDGTSAVADLEAATDAVANMLGGAERVDADLMAVSGG